ncbi:MAG: beta-ketoacyl-ACP synthase II [Elusimicrobiota bacterium]
MKRRVVITGLGILAPNGIGKENFWKATISGISGIDKIKHFDASNHPIKIAAEIDDFDPLKYMSKSTARQTDRFAQLGIAAAQEALRDSVIDTENSDRYKMGVCIGSGLGGVPFHEEQIAAILEKGYNRAHPLCVPRITPNAVSGHISIDCDFRGPNTAISTACSSGTHAVGQGFDMIRSGRADVMLVGGVEAPITPFTFAAYAALQVLSNNNDEPQKASKPFDKNRDGFVMGEGAGVLMLEELERAKKRNALIYAEVLGYGAVGGAYHMVIPVRKGKDAARTIKLALSEAEIKPVEIDYINAHGTSTTANDRAETMAIKDVFGDNAYDIPISSTKSMIGHTIGAAGGIETIVSAISIHENIIPPTINYENFDPECDLDYVPNKYRQKKITKVLTNSFGFGSNNACLVLGKYYE